MIAVATLDQTPPEAIEEFDPFNPPPPDEADERARLARALNLTDRFALFVATCNRADVRQEIVAEIKAENPTLRLIEVTVDRTVPNLLAYLSSLPDVRNADAVFVSGLESFLPNTEEVAHSSFVVNLNGTRDAFPNTLSCPLVLWLADYARNGLMRGAPDFYSIRSASFVFAAPMPDDYKIERLAVGSKYWSAWELPFQLRESRIRELNELLSQLQSLPDGEQDRKTILNIRDKLSELYMVCGRYDDAELIMRHLLSESENLFGRYDPYTVNIVGDIANLYVAIGQTVKAENIVTDRLSAAETNELHPIEVGRLKGILADIYHHQQKLEDAERLLKEALNISEKFLGPESIAATTNINNLASIYFKQGKFSAAMPLMVRALDLNQKRWGILHPFTLKGLSNLSALQCQMGNFSEGEKLLTKTITLRQLALGPEHPDVAESLFNMAVLRESQGRLQDAYSLYKQAVTINEKIFGLEHSRTKKAQEGLTAVSKSIKMRQALQPLQMKLKKHKHTNKKF